MHKMAKDPHGPQPSLPCYRCGGTGHSPDSCYQKNKKCHKCGKLGHIARVCKAGGRGKTTEASGKGKTTGSRGKMSKMHLVEADSDSQDSISVSDDEGAGADCHKVSSKSRYRKLVGKLEVNGSEIDFEMDTGAEFSTIPSSTYKRLLRSMPIQTSSVILRQYDGSVLPTKGELKQKNLWECNPKQVISLW